MFNNTTTNLFDDPTLPDLIPEDHMFNEILNVDNMIFPTMPSDVNELTRKIDNLTVELNTLGLRLEIEKTKRQRLQSSFRQLKRDVVIPCPDLLELKNELIQFKEQQNATNYQLDGENARTNTLAFRSISRICQLMVTLIPDTMMPPGSNPEIKTLLHELSLTVQQFGVHYAASYV